MKTQDTKLARKGVTLIELTVVIAVILTLITVLFIGAQTYKKHADKAACIVNQNSIQKAVRAHVNLTGITIDWDFAQLTAANLLPTIPECPATGVEYAVTAADPESIPGTVFSVCPSFDGVYNASTNGTPNHVPDPQRIAGW